MPVLRLFASAREAAGVARAEFPGATVAEMLQQARAAYGERFAAVLTRSRIWVNGEPATVETAVEGHDVVAVLPPVSGGEGGPAATDRPVRPGRPRNDGDPMGAMGGLSESAPRAPSSPGTASGGGPPGPERPGPALRRSPRAADEGGLPTRPVASVGAGPGRPAGPSGPPRGAPPRSRSGTASSAAAPPGPAGPGTASSAAAPPGPARPAGRAPDGSNGARPEPRPRPRGRARATGGSGRRTTIAGAETAAGPTPPAVARQSGSRTATDRIGLRMGELAVTYGTTRPHGRIGVLWAVATVVVTVQGEAWLAAWLSVMAFVGGSQAAAARRTVGQRPPPGLAAILASAAPIAAVFGVRYMIAVVVGALVLAMVAGGAGHGRRPREFALALVIGAVLGAAAAGPVLTRDLGIAPALFLIACAASYDAGAYLIGTGASSAWEGPVAGVVALIPVALIGAIILSPPYPSGTPLGLALLAAFLAPLGPLVGTGLLGSRNADAPGLRRLDSLIVLGPVWAWFSTSLIR